MNLDKVFSYQAPNESQIKKYNYLRNEAKKLAGWIHAFTPMCHEQVVSLDRLREVVMWANAGIALYEEEEKDECKTALQEDKLEAFRNLLYQFSIVFCPWLGDYKSAFKCHPPIDKVMELIEKYSEKYSGIYEVKKLECKTALHRN